MSSNINKFGIKGSYEIQLKNKDGSVLIDTGEQDNLILDGALDFISPFSTDLYLTLGSGVVTEPAVTDTSLGNQVYSESTLLFRDNYTTDSGGLTTRHKTTKVLKNTNAEFSEIGISRRVSSTDTQLTRALIKDASGTPTTISVTSDQELHITYYVYFYIPWVIGSGITSTPHGDLEWVYKLPVDESSSSNDLGSLASMATNPYGWSNVSFSLISGNTTKSESNDIANRTRTMTLHRAAITSSRTISAGGAITGLDAYFKSTYRLYAVNAYTLPANYDFTITLQVSWGRLP